VTAVCLSPGQYLCEQEKEGLVHHCHHNRTPNTKLPKGQQCPPALALKHQSSLLAMMKIVGYTVFTVHIW